MSGPRPDLGGYGRLGRLDQVTDVLGTRTFAYNGDLQLETETVSGTLYSKVLTRDYEDGAGVPGRFAGAMVGTAIDPDADYAAGFFYDAVGRPSRVTGPGLPAYGAAYNYLADSGLIEQVDFMTDATTIVGSSVRSYEPQRDLLTQVQNTWTGHTNPISTYAYESDTRGRRNSVVRTGEAFTADHFDLYGYSDRNELTASDRYLGSDPEQTQNPVPTADHAYVYDPIGNRDEFTAGTNPTTNYTANNVNQYTATTDPTESFTHDADGNMTADGTLTYAWDAENRLISVAPASSPVEGDKMLTLTYDYRGRRVRKVVDQWSGSAWLTLADVRFVWDRWLLLLEFDGLDSNAVIRKYAWGLDISGTRQGAAGIGGLLATHDESTSKNYAYFYDANGNVGQLIDTSDGSIAAHYEYDPYGGFLATTGIYATINPFCFSTKYLDTESNLYYYGYRYYAPRLGRWLNRDPLNEQGGSNLYAFMANGPTNTVDALGRQPSQPASQPTHQPVKVVTQFCGKWTLLDGRTIELADTIRQGVQSACDQLRRNLAEIDNLEPHERKAVETCINKNPLISGWSMEDIKAGKGPPITYDLNDIGSRIRDIIDSACDPNKPRKFICTCKDCKDTPQHKYCKSGTKPDMVTVSTRLGGFKGQPIYICTCNLSNPEADLGGAAMIHELSRWWSGDDIAAWDKILGVGGQLRGCIAAAKRSPQQ